MPRSTNSGWYALRFAILERDDYTCRYCGRTAPSVPLEVDHVLAVTEGGTDDPTNLVTCCWSCNRGKEGLRARRGGGVAVPARAPAQPPIAKPKPSALPRRFTNIPCGECGLPADTMHILPHVIPTWDSEKGWCNPTVDAACPAHDPGGYWVRLQELADEAHALNWLRHLGHKRGRPDRVVADWLREQSIIDSQTWTLRCIECANDCKWVATDICVRCMNDICGLCIEAHLDSCEGAESAAPRPAIEFKAVNLSELMTKPRPVRAMWNGRRN